MCVAEAVSRVQHPAGEDLRRFMAGELVPAKVREVVRHLLTRCPVCVGETRRLWDLGEPARPAAVHGVLLAGEAGVWL